jgi:pimeloyl-ACP methyl ester carboxylesterase
MATRVALILTVMATMAAVTAAVVLETTTAVSAAPAAAVTWSPCPSGTLARFRAECGYVAVPLDHDDPAGPTVQLAVSRIRHTVPDDQYQGVVLVNPGGPGGSGLVLSVLGQFVPKGAGAAYDWIGFDPRGVGSSRPALSCLPDYQGANRPDYLPLATERIWLDRSKSYATACGTNGGRLLENLTTIDSAKDLDAIRAALGVEQINYLGFSYGTYLAQVYTTLFPTRMRRMILDSNVDPRNVWYQANLNQDVAFEANIKTFFGWVAKYDAVYHLGRSAGEVERRWYAEQNGLRSRPAGGLVGPDEWTDIFLQAGYYQSTWTELGDLFANWVKDRNPQPLVERFVDTDNPGDDNGFAIYAGVQCTDVQWPKDWNQWRRDNWFTYFRAPFETWGNAWFNAPCVYWPAKAGTPVEVDGAQVPPSLLIGETQDAATPFEGNLEVRRRFPQSVLLAGPGGTTHAGSLNGNECVDGAIADYLATGALPTRKPGDVADATCAPLPPPDPTAVEPEAFAAQEAAAPEVRPFRPALKGRNWG